jgi:hypothetical protein
MTVDISGLWDWMDPGRNLEVNGKHTGHFVRRIL